MGEPTTPPERLISDDGHAIAYHRLPGRVPGVIFLTGYKSDMTGGKAIRLQAFCRDHGRAFVRFDYLGHGASSGRFEDGTIGRWTDDATLVLDRLSAGPQVLVGSSLGGWIMLLAALRRPERVAGLLGIASAPDFTEDIVAGLSPSERRLLDEAGVVRLASPYDPEPTPVTRRIIEEGRRHLVLRGPIPIRCPVRLIHGTADPDVPWTTSLKLMERLASTDAELTLIKGGGHRLSAEDDLRRLTETLTRLLARIEH